MRTAGVVAIVLVFTVWVGRALAQPTEPAPSAILSSSPEELAASLRGMLLTFLPSPLFVDNSHWDQQREVVRGLKWKGSGLDFHAESQRSLKNDGLWWRVRVTAPDVTK